MADAIIKVSWRISAGGKVEAQGGICGTCFTLESGKTVTYNHGMDGLFVPNDGYDQCRVFIADEVGATTEIFSGNLHPFPDFDTCLIDYTSSKTYRISGKPPDAVPLVHLRGYEAHTAPFEVFWNENTKSLDIRNVQLAKERQIYLNVAANTASLDIVANDMTVSGKQGYIMGVVARIGLSGGPMLDAATGDVAAMCFLGLPPDVVEKTQIAAIDLRQMPFL